MCLMLFGTIITTNFASKLLAQSVKEFKKRHEQAKLYLREGNYSPAKALFSELQKPHKNNHFVENSYYFYGLTSFKDKNFPDAEKSLNNLLTQFPDYQKKDEVFYLLANIAFDKKEDNIAFDFLDKMKDIELTNEASEMKGFYMIKRDLKTLKNLNAVYPNDKMTAQVLIDKLGKEAESIKDIDYMNELIEIYNIDQPSKTRFERSEKNNKTTNKKRDTLHIGVFLPFDLKRTATKKGEKDDLSNTSLNMYQAMRIAKRHLDTTGVFTKIIAYDIRHNPDTLTYMHKKGEFDRIDVFVGPIFDDDFERALEIAREKDILIINPMRMNEKYLEYKKAYFFTSTPTTQGVQSGEYAAKAFKLNNGIIFYSDTPEDNTLVNNHKQGVENQKGKIIAMQKIGLSTIANIQKVLAATDSTTLGYVFVSSASQAVAEEVLKQMAEMYPKVPVIVPALWKNFQSLSSEKLSRKNLYFMQPDYVNLSKDGGKFKRAFNLQIYKIRADVNMLTPSIYAYYAYDIMRSFVPLVYKNGLSDFEKELENAPEMKNTFRGLYYPKGKNDNQYLPIMKYGGEGTLILANPLK